LPFYACAVEKLKNTIESELSPLLLKLSKLCLLEEPKFQPLFDTLNGLMAKATSATIHLLFLGIGKKIFRFILPTSLAATREATWFKNEFSRLINRLLYVNTRVCINTQVPAWLKLKPEWVLNNYQGENYIGISKILPLVSNIFKTKARSAPVNGGKTTLTKSKLKALSALLDSYHLYCKAVMSHEINAGVLFDIEMQCSNMLKAVVNVEDLFGLRKIKKAKVIAMSKLKVAEVNVRLERHNLLDTKVPDQQNKPVKECAGDHKKKVSGTASK
jgi:hypothetical protein